MLPLPPKALSARACGTGSGNKVTINDKADGIVKEAAAKRVLD